MSIQLRYAAHSHVGLVCKNNRDSGYTGPHLLILADGMGGLAGGDIAPLVTVAHLTPFDQDSHAADDLLNLLHAATQETRQELMELSESYEGLAGLETTCVAILHSGNGMGMVHIGDSHAYLLRDADLAQVTTDHSFVQYLVEAGEITPEEAAHHPKRSVLLRVLGDSKGEVTLDESMRTAVMGDRWVPCSDGLSGVVSAETIGDVPHSESNPEICCKQLVALVLKPSAPDDVAVVAADVVDSDGELTPTAAQVVGAASTTPVGASIGQSTPAERAAMLRQDRPLEETERAPVRDLRKLGLKAKIFTILTMLILLVVLGFSTYQAYQWGQTQYFLGAKGGEVTLFQEINQSIGTWDLYHPVRKQGSCYANLAPVIQDRFDATIALQSPKETSRILNSWQRAGLTKRPENAARPTVSPPEIATKPQPAEDE